MLPDLKKTMYTVWIQRELKKVVLEMGNKLTEDEAEGVAYDFLLTDDLDYVDPAQRFKFILSMETAELLISHLQEAVNRLK